MLRMLDARPREAQLPKSAEMRHMFKSASNDVPREDADSSSKFPSATSTTISQRDGLRSGADSISPGATDSGSDDAGAVEHDATSGRAADGKRRHDSLTRLRCNEDRGGGR
jgi:hypothetical protein